MTFHLTDPPPPLVKWQLIEPEAFHTFWQTCYNHWVGLVGSFFCGEAQGNNHNCASALCESMVLFTQAPNSKQWRDHQMSNCSDHFWREKTCPALVWDTPPPPHFPVSSSSLDHCYRESPVCKQNVTVLSLHSSLFALCRNGQLCAKCSALFSLQDCSNSVVSRDRLQKTVTKAALEQRTVGDNFRCLTQWQQAAVARLVCKGHNRLKAHMCRKTKLAASSTPSIERQRFSVLCQVGMSDLVSIFF